MENKLNQVSFIVPGKITSKGRPRARVIKSGSKGGGSYASIYTPQDTIIYENLIKMCYKEQANNYHFGILHSVVFTFVSSTKRRG